MEYWAASSTDEIGKHIWDKATTFYKELDQDGYFQIMRRSYSSYYGNAVGSGDGMVYRSAGITREGEQGELYNVFVNVFRNLLQHLIVLTTSERQALETMAMNTDYKSQAQTELGDGLLEYYQTEKRLDRSIDGAVEYAVVLGGGYVDVGWDAMAGKPYGRDPETGILKYEGDLYSRKKTPLEVIVDRFADETGNTHWKIVRRQVNKWDLVATYPELKEKILVVEAYHEEMQRFANYKNTNLHNDTDLIYVFDFYHEKRPSIEDGRFTTILPGGVVLFDGPLPYKKVQVFSCMPAPLIGTPMGYTVAFDILGIQDMINKLHSAICTNQSAFGVNNIVADKGHGITLNQLGGGLNLLTKNPGTTIDVLQLAKTAPDIFNYVRELVTIAEELSGLNSVVRGNPQGQLSGASGAAMALLASQAIQFNSGLSSQHIRLTEDVGTAVIHTLQEYAQTERVALVTGIAKRSFLKEWKAADIDQLDRAVVKRVSALSQTTAGKLDIANNLLQNGLIKDADQYIGVLKTGNLDVMTESPRSRSLLIRAENEKLRNGEPVRMLITDPHALHIQEHLTVLDDPESRVAEEITETVLAHIREHIDALKTTDPTLLLLIGEQPVQASMPQGGGDVAEVMEPMPEALGDEMPSLPNMPNMPQGTPPELEESYQQLEGNI